jgi:hypothetical protein
VETCSIEGTTLITTQLAQTTCLVYDNQLFLRVRPISRRAVYTRTQLYSTAGWTHQSFSYHLCGHATVSDSSGNKLFSCNDYNPALPDHQVSCRSAWPVNEGPLVSTLCNPASASCPAQWNGRQVCERVAHEWGWGSCAIPRAGCLWQGYRVQPAFPVGTANKFTLSHHEVTIRVTLPNVPQQDIVVKSSDTFVQVGPYKISIQISGVGEVPTSPFGFLVTHNPFNEGGYGTSGNLHLFDGAAHMDVPTSNKLGDIQANVPDAFLNGVSPAYILDQSAFQLAGHSWTSTGSFLIKNSGINTKLPLTNSVGTWTYTNNELRVTPLMASPLSFFVVTDGALVISKTVSEVCPVIAEVEPTIVCSNCESGGILRIRARSTCKPGGVVLKLIKNPTAAQSSWEQCANMTVPNMFNTLMMTNTWLNFTIFAQGPESCSGVLVSTSDPSHFSFAALSVTTFTDNITTICGSGSICEQDLIAKHGNGTTSWGGHIGAFFHNLFTGVSSWWHYTIVATVVMASLAAIIGLGLITTNVSAVVSGAKALLRVAKMAKLKRS